jgi:transcriptional regulator with XRE-family HTH domain
VELIRSFWWHLWQVSRISNHRRLLGEAIRKHRKETRFTQEYLAEKAELHPVYVGRVERGEITISIDALLRIAKALKVRVRDLVEGF